jgi:hypothetical protein
MEPLKRKKIKNKVWGGYFKLEALYIHFHPTSLLTQRLVSERPMSLKAYHDLYSKGACKCTSATFGKPLTLSSTLHINP